MWRPIGPQSTGPRVTSTVGLTPVRENGQPPPPPSGGPRTLCSRFGRQDHVGPLVCLRLAAAIGAVEQAARRPGPSCWMPGGPSGNRGGLVAACDQTCRPGTRTRWWSIDSLGLPRRGQGRWQGATLSHRQVALAAHDSCRSTAAPSCYGMRASPRPSTGVPESELPSRDSPPGASCASLLSQRLIHSPQCGSLRLCTRHRPESWLPSRECA